MIRSAIPIIIRSEFIAGSRLTYRERNKLLLQLNADNTRRYSFMTERDICFSRHYNLKVIASRPFQNQIRIIVHHFNVSALHISKTQCNT